MIKCTGAEFLGFYNDKEWWFSEQDGNLKPGEEHTYWEEASILVNGEPTDEYEFDYGRDIKPTDSISVSGGVVLGKVVGTAGPTVEAYLRRWLKAKSTTSFVVECDKALTDQLQELITKAGGKIAR
ncbi:hypothetical protein KBW71_01230 [Hydrogenophaga aromaticivorans]|uniref:hypothetical protein n=1 Tax=Hydrogenophaga aromaticivorans TaxID=2610898 RepID=UPI001B39A6D4|nr:hypothetical protein [Hydrogenophaga aromaticivorans]MBQ0917053.1 hypothetical protein [Hydrogenophaga aromaticivorans]MBU4337841.1 hypothetical protein [Actinomycetota bacterium]